VSVALSLLGALPSLPSSALAANGGGVRPELLLDELRGLPAEIRLRSLSEEDRHALVRMVDRSSPASRQARFHEPLTALPPGWARTICRVAGSRVVVAAVVEGISHRQADQPGAALGAPYDDEIVALAQVEPDVGGRGELAILVEDSYQRSGLGLIVLCAALAEAARLGVRRVKAYMLPDNDGIRALLSSLDLPIRRGHDDGKECWTIDIAGIAAR
jgi:RimJ/RimL family protein N-acetyltransferase